MIKSYMLKMAIAILLACVVLVVLVSMANASDGRRLPAQQPGVKTAPIAQPPHQGIANIRQPTGFPTIQPTIIVTPTPMPTFRRPPIATVPVAGVNPGWGVTPTPMPTFRRPPIETPPVAGVYQPGQALPTGVPSPFPPPP